MSTADDKRSAKIRAMDDASLLSLVIASRDESIHAAEFQAFVAMSAAIREGLRRGLSERQRAWVEEAARKVLPYDLKDVPVGKPVPVPAVLQNLPKKPPGRT
jgi:hypothetical protein